VSRPYSNQQLDWSGGWANSGARAIAETHRKKLEEMHRLDEAFEASICSNLPFPVVIPKKEKDVAVNSTITPKVFISYSWSSEEHEQWVEELATELIQAGIKVVLDKWDLKPGHNAFAFMQQMVNDPTIDKVLVVCDEVYSRKANELGSSGVSTETQIISPIVYSNARQERFVAVVTQRDEFGKAFLPTYLTSSFYLDFSNAAQKSESFEKLVRFVFGQPAHRRPNLGKPPSYITAPNTPSLGTTVAFNRAISALRDGKNYADGAVEEFFSRFIEGLSEFRVTYAGGDIENKADLTSDSLAMLLPYRNEAAQLFSALAKYAPNETAAKNVHRFFENLIPYMFPPTQSTYHDWDADNFKFLARELYLHLVAAFIMQEKFIDLDQILSNNFFVKDGNSRFQNSLCDFSVLCWAINSLEYKNKAQQMGKTSLTATILNERSGVSGISFRDLMQADFLLYIRNHINLVKGFDSPSARWWPDTAVYVGHFAETFEIFVRASSDRYYQRIKPLLGNIDSTQFKELIRQMVEDKVLPRFGWDTLPVVQLTGLEQLASRP
jgi:hypothetical protein